MTRRRIIFLGVVLAIVFARLIWGFHAQCVLNSELRAIAGRGEAINWSDLAPQPLPDDQNAAELYRTAAEAAEFAQKSSRLFRQHYKDEFDDRGSCSMLADLIYHAEFRRQHKEDVREILALNKKALDLSRKARNLPGTDWKMNLEIPSFGRDTEVFSRQKVLTDVLLLAAADAHDKGDNAAAVEFILYALAQAKAIRSIPTFVAYLVARKIECNAIDTLEAITPHLYTDERIRKLRDAMIAEQTVRGGFVLAFIGERADIYQYCERFREGLLWDPKKCKWERVLLLAGPCRLFLGPMWTLDEADVLRTMNHYVEAAKADNYEQAIRTASQATPRQGRLLIRPFSDLADYHMTSCWGGGSKLHFHLLASRRMAAVALAIRLYELDHGRRPERLLELVERYIPFVPNDPFDASGAKMRYLPGGKRPLLYCVGTDGRDDGGRFFLREKSETVDVLLSADHVFFLNGDRPVGRPTIERSQTQPTTMPSVPRPKAPAD